MKQYYTSILWKTRCYRYIRAKQFIRIKKLLWAAMLCLIAVSSLCCVPTQASAADQQAAHSWVQIVATEEVAIQYDPVTVRTTKDGKEAWIKLVAPDNSYSVALCEVRKNMQEYRFKAFYAYDTDGSLIGQDNTIDSWDNIEPGTPGADIAEVIVESK